MSKSGSFGWFVLVLAIMFFTGARMPAAVPPVGDYVSTQIESVRGGLIYGMDVQQKTHEVYAASETMRGGFFGVSHDPNNGTWKTDDLGKSWKRIGPGGRNVKVSASNPQVVYANDRYGLYKTTDGGKNWTTILPPEFAIGYHGLDISPMDDNVVYAGGSRGLHVSRDGGKTWQHYDLPKNEAGPAADIVALQVHPKDPYTVFAALSGKSNGPHGLWKSTDGGKTFAMLYSGSIGQGYRGGIGICASDPDTIYCAGGYTHDGGKTWKDVEGVGGGWEAIAASPKNPKVVYYTRHGAAVAGSVTGGEIFFWISGVDRNYDGTEVEGAAYDGELDILWAGGDCIWKGEKASSGKLRLVPMNAGFHDLSLSDIKSAPSGVWATSDAQGMHYTHDGKNWYTSTMGMQGMDALHHTAPSPNHPDIVYSGQEARLYKTTDGGKTWFNLLGSWYPECTIDPQDPNIVYLSTRGSSKDKMGIKRTSDGGLSFQDLGQGRLLALHPSRPKTFFAERPDGFYISADRGEHFEKISDQTNLGDFFVCPANAQLMLSARAAEGLFSSNDGGKTWSQVGGVELQGPTRFTGLGDGTIWMADPKTGLVRSGDNGKTWEKVWQTMGAMCPDPWDSSCLYMITRGGIWWIHPRVVTREEVVNSHYPPIVQPQDAAAKPETVKLAEPILVDRCNITYQMTSDYEMTGLNNNRSLLLFCRGARNVTFDGQGHSVRLGGGSAIFGDDLENVTIRNVQFVAAEAGGGRKSSHPQVLYLTNCRNLTISNCTFDAPSTVAVYTAGILTDNVVIENCRITGGSQSQPAIEGTGKHIIRGCTINTPSGMAVRLLLPGVSLLENNKIQGTIVTRPPLPVK